MSLENITVDYDQKYNITSVYVTPAYSSDSIVTKCILNLMTTLEYRYSLTPGIMWEKYQYFPFTLITTKFEQQPTDRVEVMLFEMDSIVVHRYMDRTTDLIAYYDNDNDKQRRVYSWLEEQDNTSIIQYDYTYTPDYVPFHLMQWLYDMNKVYTVLGKKIMLYRNVGNRIFKFTGYSSSAVNYLSYLSSNYFVNQPITIINNRLFAIYTAVAQGIKIKLTHDTLEDTSLIKDDYDAFPQSPSRKRRRSTARNNLRKQIQKKAKKPLYSGMDIEFCGVFAIEHPSSSIVKVSDYLSTVSIESGDEISCNPFKDKVMKSCVFYSWHSHTYGYKLGHNRVLFGPMSDKDITVYLKARYSVNEIYTIAGVYRISFEPLFLNIVTTSESLESNALKFLIKTTEDIRNSIISHPSYYTDNAKSIIYLIVFILFLGRDRGLSNNYGGKYYWFQHYPFFIMFRNTDRPLSQLEGISQENVDVQLEIMPGIPLVFQSSDNVLTISDKVSAVMNDIDDAQVLAMMSFINSKWGELVSRYNNEYVMSMNRITLQSIFGEDIRDNNIRERPVFNMEFFPMDYGSMMAAPDEYSWTYTIAEARVQIQSCKDIV